MHLIRMLYFLFSNHSNGVLFLQLGPIELFQEKN
jgi:hypothetical protein